MDQATSPRDTAHPTTHTQRQSAEYLLPSTFEERGAAVPFTTPMLTGSRVRKNWRNQLEVTVARFVEGATGSYVVPLPALPDLIALTLHDRELCKAIKTNRAVDPLGIRLAALEVALTGLAGPEAADTAEVAIKADQEDRTLQELLLLLQLIREGGGAPPAAVLNALKHAESRERVRATLFETASKLGFDQEQFETTVRALAQDTYTVGLPLSPEPARLRRMLQRLKAFQTSVSDWSRERLGDYSSQAGFCAEVAAFNATVAQSVLMEYDAMSGHVLGIIRGGEEKCRELIDRAARLAWLLDGWDLIVELWFDGLDRNQAMATLSHIYPMIPFIPRDEVSEARGIVDINERYKSGRRWVRANTDWRTGAADPEMVARLETLKAKIA